VSTQGAEEDETCVTFVITKEDHTLGNSLRYMVMKKYAIDDFEGATKTRDRPGSATGFKHLVLFEPGTRFKMISQSIILS